jgi:hypothetical protein
MAQVGDADVGWIQPIGIGGKLDKQARPRTDADGHRPRF